MIWLMIGFHFLFFVLWLLADSFSYKYRQKLGVQVYCAISEASGTVFGYLILAFILILIMNSFVAGFMELIFGFWWLYLIFILIGIVHSFLEAYRLPYLSNLKGLFDNQIIQGQAALQEIQIQARRIQNNASQRLTVLSGLAPIGILLPFLSKIFQIDNLKSADFLTVLSWFFLLLYLMLLWEAYHTYTRAGNVLEAVEKSLLSNLTSFKSKRKRFRK